MTDLTITLPIEPRGQMRPRTTVRGGHAIVYKAPADREWAAACQWHLNEALQGKMLDVDGPIRIDIVALFARTKALSAVGKKGPRHPVGFLPHGVKPDVDNVTKALLDSIRPWIGDDAIVSAGMFVKAYVPLGEAPRIIVRVRSLDGDSFHGLISDLIGGPLC